MANGRSWVREASLQGAKTHMYFQLILSTNLLDYLSLLRPLRGSGMFEVLNFQCLRVPEFENRNTKWV